MENLEISHDILVADTDFAVCRQRVAHFFAKTMLIRYDEVEVIEKESISGMDEDFRARLQNGLASNRSVLSEFLANLKGEGLETLDDLENMEKGYLSKILHSIAHLLDGFIGIDSRFYNLEEDSHGVSRDLRQKISLTPNNYWILRVKGRIAAPGEDPFNALRTFEGRTK